jgi:PAS domain S-box-containing protein
MLNAIPILVAGWDNDGVPVYWNHECERVTGWSVKEIIGNANALRLFFPDDTPPDAANARQRLGGDYRNRSRRFTCKNGMSNTIALSSLAHECPVPGWPQWGIAWELLG